MVIPSAAVFSISGEELLVFDGVQAAVDLHNDAYGTPPVADRHFDDLQQAAEAIALKDEDFTSAAAVSAHGRAVPGRHPDQAFGRRHAAQLQRQAILAVAPRHVDRRRMHPPVLGHLSPPTAIHRDSLVLPSNFITPIKNISPEFVWSVSLGRTIFRWAVHALW
jgi:hypothetical protein